MSFDTYAENPQAVFDGFPNERVWLQGGLRPNRRLQRPAAGYCSVLRFDERTTSPIPHFTAKIRTLLPHIVEYDQQSLHTTIGTYGKVDLQGFVPNLQTIRHLGMSVEKGVADDPQEPCIEFGRWLYNDEASLIREGVMPAIRHLRPATIGFRR